jgi:hypothetical protein
MAHVPYLPFVHLQILPLGDPFILDKACVGLFGNALVAVMAVQTDSTPVCASASSSKYQIKP